tara:strand:- start:1889 stop:2644 length:756 start_codon:yes stop_codon:yes gene_type:complete
MIVDVHCHLEDEAFKDDVADVVKRAKENKIVGIITNGTSPVQNRTCLELSKKYDIVKCALGLYPIDASKHQEYKVSDVDIEIEFIKKNKKNVIAIGEIGLDKKYGKDIELQKKIFSKMCSLAKELDIPVIVHSRNAELETIEELEKYGMKKVVMHCFGGRKNLVKRILDNNWHISIPVNCVRSQHFQNIVDMSPIANLLTETDAPYLGPESEQRNEPSNVPLTIKKIAEIKAITEDECEKLIYLNYQRLFM